MAFCYAKKTFETPWHFHPQHELTYIEESFGTKFIGDYLGSYEPGELVLLKSNLPHCWKNNARQDGECKSIVVQWNSGVFAKVPELSPVFEMLKTASKGIIFEKNETAALMQKIRNFPQLKGYDLYLQLLKVLVALSKYTHRTLSEASFLDDIPSSYSSRIAKVHDFVEVNFDRKIYLREIAGATSMSEQSFSRFFTKMMGRSFFVFLNEYRIKQVCRQLLDSSKQVSEIAYVCGYENLPFFYRQFKKFMGCQPMEYRKKYIRYG